MYHIYTQSEVRNFKHICVSLEQKDADYIDRHGYSPTKLLRLQIQRLRESMEQKVLV